MAQPLHLEDFSPAIEEFQPLSIDGAQLESERLAAFDKGYAAGWEDASQAAAQERAQAEANAQARLQELGFTFHEARAHVMLALTPLLDGIVRQVLPRIVRETLGARIVEELRDMADIHSEAPLELLVPEGQGELVEGLLSEATALPMTIREEPSLAEGQLYLRLGEAEREIDLAGLSDRLTDAITALDTINKDTLHHG